MLEPLGRPSITLVMRAMTTGVCLLTLVMEVVSPPRVKMLTACVVLILIGATSFFRQ